MELAYSQEVFGRPFVMPPNVPKERVDALRKAFMQALAGQGPARRRQSSASISIRSRARTCRRWSRKSTAMPANVVAKAKEALVYKAVNGVP